jgi:putative ABC transport system ATP-binding protein
VIWIVGNPTLARFFERVTVFDQGRLVEDGHPGELAERNGTYARLVA